MTIEIADQEFLHVLQALQAHARAVIGTVACSVCRDVSERLVNARDAEKAQTDGKGKVAGVDSTKFSEY